MLPPLVLLGLPAYAELREATAHHPGAAALLAPDTDATGAAGAWLLDLLGRSVLGDLDRVLAVLAIDWLLVTLLTAGLVGCLSGGERSLRQGCRRFGGRFLLLGLYSALLVLLVQVFIEGVLRPAQSEAVGEAVTQTVALRGQYLREGLLMLSIWLVWLLHTCARVDLVVHDRRSVLRAIGGGIGLLLDRLPALLLVETGMLLAAGAVALLYGLTGRILLAPGPRSGWFGLCALLLAGTFVSLLRTGVEIGTLEARCRALAPDPSPNETLESEVTPDPIPATGPDQER